MNDTEQKEILMMALRAGASTFPVIGQVFNDLLDFRSKIKQERFNNFINSLGQYLTEKKDVKLDAFKDEEFTDLFESVIKRVVLTKSKIKHERFKKILLKHIEDALPNHDNYETYLDLISNLSELEINILARYYERAKTPYIIENATNTVDKHVQNEISILNITESQFIYNNQSLFSKGLVFEEGFNATFSKPLRTMKISEFGTYFCEFLKQ